MQTILDDVTVIQLGHGVAADLPTMVMADNGARVVKVEPLDGDPGRRTQPSAFLVWNRGKESIALDLSTDGDRARAAELVAEADVVVEAFGVGVADRMGLGPEAMRAVNPALVYCSIKGFGTEGPYAHLKAYEGVVAAKVGGFAPAGFRDGPAFFGMPRASVAAGHHALQGVVAALFTRLRTGRGQLVETDLFAGLTTYDYFGTPAFQLTRRHPDRYAGRGTPGTPGGMLCSADGRWVLPTNRLRKEYEALVRAVDLEDVWEDPRFQFRSGHGASPSTGNPEDDAALWDLVTAAFRSRPLDQWLPRMAAEDDLAAEWARTCEEGLDHPQVVHNGHVVEIDDPRVGPMRQVGPIALFSETPSVIGTPAPAVDQHAALRPLRGTALPSGTGDSAPEHPLAGVTIVELGHHFAMPYAITLVAALGARVIKVEPPEGDHMRDLIPIPEAGAHKVMDGKESVIADVTTDAGREIVYDLARRADVFALGLRQPAADRMRMNEAVIRAVNPGIVYFSATGYGDSGPFVGKAMHAGTASAAVGSLHHQAGAWLDPARAEGLSIDELRELATHFGGGAHNGDAASAASAAGALVLAIYAQRRHGIGQYVRTTMLVGNAYSYSDDFNSYAGKPPSPLPDEQQLGLGPLYRLYPARSGWVFLAAPSQSEWIDLCRLTGLPADDPRFTTPEKRARHADELTAALAGLFSSREAGEWEELLATKGIGCVEVNTAPFAEVACTDPILQATDHMVEMDHPVLGRLLRHGLPQRFSETPGRLATGCWAGQHTAAVLEELGYSQARIAELDALGVTASRRDRRSP